MNTDQILALLSEKNLALAIDGDELIVRGEKQRLDSSLIALVRENKQQLLDSLREGTYAGPADGAGAVPPNRIPAGCTEITPEMLPLVELTAAEIAGVVGTVPGGAANVQDIYPLAPLQEGILFHHLLGSEGDPYLMRTAYRFENRARLDAFLGALQSVIDRHDALRTAILWEGLTEPVQVVLRHAPLVVEEVSADPAAGDVAEQLSSRFDPQHYRLDVRQALLRGCIAREPDGDGWSMVVLQHHLWGDHMSLELMQQEVEAHLLGTAAELPAPQPFRNFIAQARFGVDREEQNAFFRELLGDVEEPTAPFGLIDVQGDGSDTREAHDVIDASLVERLRACARALGVSTASIVHVAWARVLARVSGRNDVVFGTILFGRMQGGEGADRALGMFMNTLPVRIRVDERGVRESVEQAQLLLAQLLRHEHAPLALAQRCSAVPISTPLFSSLLNYRHGAPKNEAVADAWQGITVRDPQERTNYPVGISVDDNVHELGLVVKTHAPVDPDRLCAYVQTSLAQLVDALESNPEQSLSSIDVLPASERHELLVEWNATDRPYAEAFVHDVFQAHAAASPAAIAVEHDGAQLSYGELNARANRLARHLRSLGVRPEMRVGVCMERSPELVVALLGVLKAGGAYVPLDPSYPPERLSYLVQDSAPGFVLTHGRVSIEVHAVLHKAGVRVIDVIADADGWADQPSSDLDGVELRPDSLAYVIYTSGSTGNPKGVMVEHRQLASRLLGAHAELQIGAGDVFPNLASPAFDIALFEVLMPLLGGGRSLLVSASQVRDMEQLRALTQDATVFHAVPSLMEAWLEALGSGGERVQYASLQTLLVGGEAVPEGLLRKLTARFPQARVIELYGPTEAVIVSTRYRADGVAAAGVAHCIGRPFANTRVYILDAQMQPAPIGVAGELYVGGMQVARGYLNRAELTAERFVVSPFVAGDRLYKTGDLGRYLPDGNIEFLGRTDFQVKIRGFRIELGEIEARLGGYPGVREAVVVALEDVAGEKRLVAYYTADAAAEIGAEALRAHVLSLLPEYMVPAAYVQLESLPLTANGKLNRKALPAPDGGAYASRAYEAPVGEAEMTIAAIWRELLGVERVGRNDNFFELGGHSLLVIVALERLRRVGLHVDAGDLFASPTLSALASVVQAESLQVVVPPNGIPAGCDTITPEMLPLVELTAAEIAGVVGAVPGGAANVQDIYPLAPLQEGMLFHHLLGGEGDPYVSSTVYRFESRERVDAYLGALQSVIARHDILRTAIMWEGLSEPVQVVLRHAPLTIEEIAVDPAAGDAGEQLAARFNPRRCRLNMHQAPIMRVYLAHDTHDDSWSMVLLKHHVLGDYTASEMMEREITAYLGEAAHELPAPQPFRNFIAQARLGISRDEHEAFFRELLGDVEEPTAPFGLIDVRGESSRKAHQLVDVALAERMRACARALGVSTASVCHVAWARVLARVSGRNDVVFGTLLFGRMAQGGEGAASALGMFLNTLPARIHVDGRGVRESVEQAHMLLAQLLRHEHAPLALAQRCSAVPASTPLFSSLLNYRHISDTDAGQAWTGITVRGTEERTNYPVSISVNDHGAELSVSVTSDASLDPDRVCAYMQTSLAQLVDALERSPKRSLSSIDVLPASERHELLVEWNATDRPYAEAFVHEVFQAHAAASPDAIAVEHDGAQLSYGELNARANRLARHLRSLGVRPEMRVAVCMERSPELVVALLGVLKAGGAYVPLDPSYPLERLSYLVQDSAPVLVLTHGHVSADVHAMLRDANVWAIDVVTDAERWTDEPSGDLDRAELRPDNLAYVIYTSGSTGNPKGVMVEHHQFALRLLGANDELGFGAGDVFPNLASPAFDIALFEVLMPLLSGGRSLLLGASQVKDIDRLRALTQDATVFHAVPSLVEAWLEALSSAGESSQYASLRTVLVGGEAVPERLLRKLVAQFPHAHVLEMYGPTESVMVTTRYRADGGTVDGVAHCIGRPFANTRAYILDAQMQPAPIGVAGELYVGGLHVARGYLNRAELTAERFVASPFVAGDRLYKTGDLARYLPDGNIEFLGRTDFQVKIRGFRIELGEIEARLGAYPGVREAVVVALEDVAGEKRLVAYYTADATAEIGAEALRAHVLSLLPEYMVPAAYVQLESLPLTANGKLNRKALPAPDGGAYASRAYEAPVGEAEMTIAAIWRELLSVERVGRNDNFFELGGHSLLVVAALERLRRVGLHVDAGDLFASPTLSALASVVQAESLQVVVPPNGIPADCDKLTPEMLPLVKLTAAEIAGVVGAVPGGAANVQDIYPLAPLQEGMLFHHLLGDKGDPYLTRTSYRFESRERLDAYLGALQSVIDRHDILRTAILWEGLPEPVQVVLRHTLLAVEEIAVDPTADVMEQLVARFSPRRYRLDLRQAPLLRAFIARQALGDGWSMVLLKHHMLGDQTASELMHREVEAYLLGTAAELPASQPFRNFIAQARLGIGQDEHEAFFRQLLGDVEEPTAPFGLVNVQGDGSRTRQAHEAIDAALAERLRACARALGVTTASVCHVAWARVLARVSGRNDVVFGTLLFGRMAQGGDGAANALGMFMNTLPVRIRVDERGVRESVEQAHMLLAQLLRHEHAPLALTQRCSAVPASTPLFSSLLNYRHGFTKGQAAADRAWQGIEVEQGGEERTNYPVGISVNDHGDELGLSVKSDASVDPDRLCAYMQTSLAQLVDALESNPKQSLSSIDVLPAGERHELLIEWNATDRPYAEAFVHDVFQARAAASPDAIAVEHDGAQLSYGELNARANRLARHLRSLGVRPEMRVGVCMERSLELVVGLLGVLKAGGAYVPLDPSYPLERLSYLVQDSAPVLVLTHARVSADAQATLHEAGVRVIDVVADAERWADEPSGDLDRAELRPDSLAYVIYTSGSTGNPKGVMVEHRQLASRLLGAHAELQIGAGDVFPNLASPAFDIALFEVLMPLLGGGRSLLVSASQVRDMEQLRALTQDATVFHAVPSLMEAWLEALGSGGESVQYASLQTLLVGGEAVPERLLRKLTARFPHARVIELYGPTEAVIVSTRYRADGVAAAGVAHCIGRPFANTRVYILDAQMHPAPVGVAGELYVGGAQVARGYLNRAELTAERFVVSPFVAGDRLYKTGDLGRYLPDGNIEFLGRTDFQVKIRGFRIELGEIEARLGAYPGVREAVVVALEDVAGEKRLVAYYTADAAAEIGAETLRAHVLSLLPEYMVPAAYVQLESLPLTANGKLNRKALPAPDGGAYASRAYEAPVGEAEMTIAAIWRELLSVERVGRNDNFFELGGHSLLVIVALERLRRVGLHVDAGDLFASPTLSALASVVQAESLQVVVPPNGIPAGCDKLTPEMLPLVKLTAAEIAGVVGAVPGGAANVQDIYPLAPLQEGMLFHHLLGDEGDPYLTRTSYRFESRERLDAYLGALQFVIARHDILRTAIMWEGLSEPVQVVLRHAPLTAEEIAVDPAADVMEQLVARFSPRRHRLDLRQAPILRAYIAREPVGGAWSMVMLKHHLLGDQTANELMHREVEAYLLGTAAELPASQPFRNFIAQARLGIGQDEHEAFFRELLGDVEEPTAPFGLVNVQGDGSRTRQAHEAIDAALAERLRACARALGVTTASVCHVAWAQVLARVSGRNDVVFGTLLFGRMAQGGEGAANALGMFMNTLPVRIRVDERGVRESVEQAHMLLAQLLRHEHAPLALAQRCSAVPASTPLFSSLLNYRHGFAKGQAAADRAWQGIEVEQGGEERTNYPVGISVNDHGAELSLSVKSDASVDPDRLCAYMQTSLAQLVDALENNPKQSLSSIDVLPASERHELLVEWNATERPYAEAFVHDVFQAQAAASPAAIAVEHDGAQLSYGELNARANRLARHLRSLGVRPEMRVGVCMERSLELVVALLGVLKAGGAYVPLDPSYPPERLSYLVQDSAPGFVLTHGRVSIEVHAVLHEAGVRVIDVIADADGWADQPSSDLDGVGLTAQCLAYVIYTSGSTGNPKGVLVEHHQLASRLLGAHEELGIGAGDVLPNLASPAFDIALFEVLMPLLGGGRSLLVSASQVRDMEQLRALTQDATVFHAVPSLMEAWLEALGSGGESAQYASLQTLLVGGEAVPEGLLRKLTARFPQARVIELYGPTEAVIVSTRYRADGVAAAGVAHCIGRPFANTRVYILDAQMQPAPVGVAGELYVGGAQVARGYLNRAELTAERFVVSPFVAGDRLYKTGDLGRYLPDGNIEFLGRTDFQVKIRGFRIELGEIEARLGAYPGVREAVVVALEDVAGEKRLVAYYTADATAEIGAEALRAHVLSLLPEYMVPAAYVQLESLPLTANGKLNRKALPAPDGGAYASRAYEAPVGEAEMTIAAIWRELLSVERVGRNDNFFELGGHSLLVIVALERLRRVGLHVDAGDLFASPTLSALASVVQAESLQVVVPPNVIPADCDTITPEMLPLVELTAAEIAGVVGAVPGGAANVQDIYPLAPLQEGMLFHHMLGGEGDPYLGRSAYRFESRERLDAYLGALQFVIARHDIFRTAILWEGLTEPVQVVLRHAPLAVEEIAVDPAAGDVAEQLAARFSPRHYRLDLRQAPIMRAFIAREPVGDAWSMVMLKHHSLGDHTAMELLLREVEAHLLGTAAELPAPQPFRNFIAQARLGVSREEHEAFFRELLGDVEEPTAPFGLVNVQGDGSSTRKAHQLIDAGLAERLRACARTLGVSTASMCHVAWAQVLARVSGRNDVVFGTVLFGRMQGGEGAENALGIFMNTLPVRIRVDERGVRESVEQAHMLLAQLLRHEHAPLALTQRCSAVPASTPLFSSLLNYRHGFTKGQAGGERAWKGIEVEQGGEERTNYPVGISVNDRGAELSLSVKSDASVDPDRLCAYMQTSLAQLVDALESNPKQSLSSIDVLPASERHELLVEWNATDRPYADAFVHDVFQARAAASPDAVAVEHDGAQLSYGELNVRANRLARHLRSLGVRPEMRVGVCMERSLELVVGLLGVLKAGGAYVPLDPSYPLERLSYLVQDSAPVLVLTHARVSADAQATLHEAGVRVIDVVADAELWSHEPSQDLDGVGLTAQSLAYVIYTSGSTGNPKGVLVEHRQLASRLLGAHAELQIGAGDVFPNLASPAFDIALFEVLMPLLGGGRSLLVSASQVRDMEQLRALTQDATVFHAVPSLMEAWLEALGSGGERAQYASLQTLLVGGEAVPEGLLRKLTARFPQARVIELYGPTEAVIVSTRYRADGVAAAGVAHCIGRPFANTRVYILDAQMQPAPIGVAGELYVGGLHVARGYLNRAELTAERFVASPFVHGDRLYKTGDLGRYLGDGNIEFLGRTDFQVKIRGFRIELGEIEARLGAYPGVREAVVVALEDVAGEKRLVAYYTADAAAEIGAEALRAHVLSLLPEYMVPAAYVQLESLPLTANGKLNRKALPAPDGGAYASRAYEAPVGEAEMTIAAIWCELLSVERVGRNDNFFELGGHSLLVVAALERLRRVGLHVDAGDLFALPTLSDLAAVARPESLQVVVPPNGIAADCDTITPEMLPLVKLTAAEIAGVVGAVPGGAANVQDIYPLAPLQEGMLFHHMLGGDGDPYLGRGEYQFESRERLDAYLGALQAVIARHDILRTAIMWDGLPEPVQVVLRHAPLTVEEIAVDPAAGGVTEQLAARLNPRHYRLDLRQAPLMRACVARQAAGDGWSMVMLKHHMLGDHTAMEMMQREVTALLQGAAAELPAPQPFRNFVAQARLGVSPEEHASFFRELLGDVEEPTAPFGLVNVQGDGSSTRRTHQLVDASLAERLRASARAAGVSTASVCHVAWARVLARVSGRNDVVFGTVLFGRMQGAENGANALGMFMNTLPVRIHVDERGVRESVKQAHLLLAQLLRHEHAPLALAQRCSAVPVSTPLFSSLLNYRHGAPKKKADGGAADDAWRGITAKGGEERTNYPVGISVNDHGDELSLSVKSDASIDPDWLCGFMQTALAELVDALEHSPTRSLLSIDVLPASERHELLVEWNATDRPYAEAFVHDVFQAQAAASPDAIAVEHDGAQLSYGELNARANRLAQHLRSLGVRPEMRVGVCVERSLELVVALLGVLKAGGAYVPLDPSYPLERLSYLVQDSAPVLVLTHGAVSADVQTMLHEARVRVIDVVADAELWSHEPSSDLDGVELRPDSLAYVIYTSGSTGNPKGVMVEHRQLASRLLGAHEELGIGAGDVFPNLASPAFDIALFEVLVPLLGGGRSLLVSASQVRDMEQLRALTQDATVFHAVPSLMEAWLEALGSGGESVQYASLQTLLVGGEAVPEGLLRKLTARFPQARVIELYGPTEAVIVSTRYRADGVAAAGVAHCIGRPFANTRVYILDAQMQPAPIGVAGELYVGGVHVARGYLHRADLTAERFVVSPFVAGDRLYKTGDLGRYLPDGNIEFLGRTDFQVKIRGFRIELGEIEARLGAYPGVREAVVVALEDVAGEKRLVAYYTADAVAEIGAEALRAHVLSLLPEYMVPAAYVQLESLPLTANGKLNRKALPAPDGGAYASRAYEVPEGELETTIAAIWCELLGVERVGRNDNFFELGGHSLLAMSVLSRVRQALQIDVDLNELFSHPALRDFAQVLKTSSRSALPAIVPIDRSERIPLSFAQERLWFLAQLDPAASRAYHLPFSLPMKGDLDVAALRRALDEIVARHESLRTTFTAVDGEPSQRIGPADSGFHLVQDDLRGAADVAGELKKLSAQHAGAPFDFEAGPLIRGRLVRLADDEHVLMVATHHIVSDGWSSGVFMRELRTLYAAYCAGEQSPLAPLAVQYADYAVWQRRWISGEVLQEQASYWQRTLADAPVLLELPTDRARPAVRDPRGARVGFKLDAETTAGLKALSRRHGATLYMTLLAAWGALLSRLSGQEDVVIGTAVANRVRPEIEPLIGFFANTLPLRLNYGGSPTMGELLERVMAQAIAAQEHQDLPFEHIVELVNPPRSLAYSPLFQTMFLWQNTQRTERALPGLKAEAMGVRPSSGGSAQFDLTLDLSERGDEIAGSFSYVTALFDAATIERYGAYLQRMIAAMVADDS